MSADLKAYQTQLKKLKAEYSVLSDDVRAKQRDLSTKHTQIKIVEGKIESITEKDIVISEHAILRYLERVKGIDLELIKEEIISENVMAQYEILGNGTYPINGEFKAVIRDNVVITIK